jgi:hypothetical protein
VEYGGASGGNSWQLQKFGHSSTKAEHKLPPSKPTGQVQASTQALSSFKTTAKKTHLKREVGFCGIMPEAF